MESIDKARELNDEGIQLAVEEEDLPGAIKKFLEAIDCIKAEQRVSFELSETQFLVGMAYLKLDENQPAEKYFKKAAETNNNDNKRLSNKCYLYLGMLKYSSNKYSEAIDLLNNIKIKIGFDDDYYGNDDDERHSYFVMQGVSYSELGNNKKALKFLYKALNIPLNNNRDFEVYYHIGCIYYQMNNYKKALKFYEESISVNPDQPEGFKQLTLLRLAYMYMYKEEYEKAIQLCEEIEQKQDINIRLENLYVTRGRCHSRLGQVMQALKYFEKAWEMKEQLNDGWRNRIQEWLVEYYTKVGNQKRVSELKKS